jgi:hypothetical protein
MPGTSKMVGRSQMPGTSKMVGRSQMPGRSYTPRRSKTVGNRAAHRGLSRLLVYKTWKFEITKPAIFESARKIFY